MRKYHTDLNEPAVRRRRRSRAPLAVGLGLALLISPLVFEGGSVVYAHWMTMAGKYHKAETPILDTLSDWSRTASFETRRYTGRVFVGGTLNASKAVPFAIAWAVLMAVVFLRRVRSPRRLP